MEEKLKQMFLLQGQFIQKRTVDILIENGFDDDSSLKLIDVQTIEGLGIEEDLTAIVDTIQNYYEQSEAQYEVQDGIFEQDIVNETNAEQEQDVIEQIPLKSITSKLLVTVIQVANKKEIPNRDQELAIQRVTHLQLNNRKIEKIASLDACSALKVLYLQDNLIQTIEGLDKLKNLIQLNLYSNKLSKIEGFDCLGQLRRLYLEKNMITRLEGLTKCQRLEELYLGSQNTDCEFTFDEYSLAAISSSLSFLDIQESNVINPAPLYYLENIRTLILKRNPISDFEQITPILQTMNRLEDLDLSDCQVTKIVKYRDQVVLLTRQLKQLDTKMINQQERQYLNTLVQRKSKQVDKPVKKEKTNSLQISGQEKLLHAGEELKVDYGYTEDQKQYYETQEQDENMRGNRMQGAPNATYARIRTVNLNSGTDFTGAGIVHNSTKYQPKPIRKH